MNETIILKKREKIPVKFHLDGNKIIFEEYWTILSDDHLAIEQTITDDGKIHIDNIYIERRTI